MCTRPLCMRWMCQVRCEGGTRHKEDDMQLWWRLPANVDVLPAIAIVALAPRLILRKCLALTRLLASVEETLTMRLRGRSLCLFILPKGQRPRRLLVLIRLLVTVAVMIRTALARLESALAVDAPSNCSYCIFFWGRSSKAGWENGC